MAHRCFKLVAYDSGRMEVFYDHMSHYDQLELRNEKNAKVSGTVRVLYWTTSGCPKYWTLMAAAYISPLCAPAWHRLTIVYILG